MLVPTGWFVRLDRSPAHVGAAGRARRGDAGRQQAAPRSRGRVRAAGPGPAGAHRTAAALRPPPSCATCSPPSSRTWWRARSRGTRPAGARSGSTSCAGSSGAPRFRRRTSAPRRPRSAGGCTGLSAISWSAARQRRPAGAGRVRVPAPRPRRLPALRHVGLHPRRPGLRPALAGRQDQGAQLDRGVRLLAARPQRSGRAPQASGAATRSSGAPSWTRTTASRSRRTGPGGRLAPDPPEMERRPAGWRTAVFRACGSRRWPRRLLDQRQGIGVMPSCRGPRRC